MADLFISYGSGDRPFVRVLVTHLQRQGWTVFWDEHLNAGSTPEFDMRLEEELDRARCVVVIWSRKSVESRWVRSEANRGARRKVLVQVRVESVQLPLGLDFEQAVDVAGRDEGRWLPKLYEAIGRCAQISPGGPADAGLIDDAQLSYDSLAHADPAAIQKLVAGLKLLAAGGAERLRALRALGLCYLHSELYDAARSALEQAVRDDPEDAGSHYLLALSLMGGRPPRKLSLKDVRTIESHLQRAMASSQPVRQAFELAGALKYEYYLVNGMRAHPPPAQLLERARAIPSAHGETQRLVHLATLGGTPTGDALLRSS
jgi:tetratricopeptide (TPR) repeat protein